MSLPGNISLLARLPRPPGGASVYGNVVGPASATANGAAIYNGTTGKIIKDSKVVITPAATGATIFVPDNGTLAPGQSPTLLGIAAMGSTIKAQGIGTDIMSIVTSANLSNGQICWNAVYLPSAQTLTGITWFQQVQGSYTASNFNGVGLYSYSGGTLTQVAVSANTAAALSTDTANTYSTLPFTGTYAAAAGLYYTALIYCRSAEVTPPSIGNMTTTVGSMVGAVGTNSSAIYMVLNAQTALPTPSQLASGLTSNGATRWVGVY